MTGVDIAAYVIMAVVGGFFLFLIMVGAGITRDFIGGPVILWVLLGIVLTLLFFLPWLLLIIGLIAGISALMAGLLDTSEW